MGFSVYQIKKWCKMLTGKSIFHVNQSVGVCYSKTEVAGYYNDLTEKVTKDDPNILIPKYHMDTGEEIYFSIGVFQYGLASYDMLLKTQDTIYKDKLLACAQWAISNQQEDGSWVTFAFKAPNHPYSSMAQGEGCSMLLRAHLLTGEQKYFEAAKKAIAFMLKPLKDGGTTEYTDCDVIFYEHTGEPPILNGWIFSYWGLRDYVLVSGDKDASQVADATLKSLLKMLPRYNKGYWSKYDLTKRTASPFYHKLHIAQLQVMYDLTGEEPYRQYAVKWKKYLKNPLFKTMAIVRKSMEKILER